MPHDTIPEPTDSEASRERPASPDRLAAAPAPARRSVMALGAALGIAGATTLAACGSGSSGGGSGSSTSGAGAATPSGSASGGAAAGAAGGGALAKLADVPVGGAKLAKGADGKPIVITQPTAGKVEAVSALCTHQGCAVLVQGTKLNCPCHGSQFDLTGKVLQGPAAAPLPPVAVKVSGTDIVAG